MKIYFAGSMRGGRADAQLYADLIAFIQMSGHKVLTEHVGYTDWAETELVRNPRDIYERDMAWLTEADAFIAELTTPSLGVGYEVAKAEEYKKPFLGLYRLNHDRSLTAMVSGNKNLKIVDYTDIADAKKAITSFLAKFQ